MQVFLAGMITVMLFELTIQPERLEECASMCDFLIPDPGAFSPFLKYCHLTFGWSRNCQSLVNYAGIDSVHGRLNIHWKEHRF